MVPSLSPPSGSAFSRVSESLLSLSTSLFSFFLCSCASSSSSSSSLSLFSSSFFSCSVFCCFDVCCPLGCEGSSIDSCESAGVRAPGFVSGSVAGSGALAAEPDAALGTKAAIWLPSLRELSCLLLIACLSPSERGSIAAVF